MENKYVCACGLTCVDCMFYKKELYETAGKLRRLIDGSKIDVFLSMISREEVTAAMADHLGEDTASFRKNFKAFGKMGEFLEVLDGLVTIQCKTTCREAGGCSMCGTTKECAAIKCVKEKKLDGCWECREKDNCEKLLFQKMSYGKTIDENFRIINEQGIEAVPSRGDDYYEWQRRMKAGKTDNTEGAG